MIMQKVRNSTSFLLTPIKDELLGIAQVDFNDILKTPGTPVNKWVELVTKKKTGDAGQVQIELVYQELLIESR